jgi:tetratricopeptide (TPR) repeat protein
LHEARRRVDATLALEGGEPRYRAKAMEALGGILWWQGKMAECRDVYEAVLTLQRQIKDEREIANALYNFGLVVAFTDRDAGGGITIEDLEVIVDEADEIYTRLGDVGGLGDVEWARGTSVAFVTKDLDTAIDHMKRATVYYGEAGNEFGMGWALFETGSMLQQTGRYEEGWEYLQRGLALFAGHRDVSAAVLFLANLAAVAKGLGDNGRAERLAGAFNTLRISSGVDIVDLDINQIQGLEYKELEALIGDRAVPYREGRAMGFDQAVAYALAGPVDEGFEAQLAQ